MTLSLLSRHKTASHRVFYLSGRYLGVYHWDGRRMLDPLVFSADDVGLADFATYLERAPKTSVHLLVDVVEEDFRQETIPHVLGRDRRALIANKQGRLFRETRYAQAVFQGRETEGRRDDRVLFTALIRPELLDPWLGQINRLKIPLTGIYSVPVLSQGLLKRIPVTSVHTLLVSLQSMGGLRQTFFDGQELKLSRLAIMPRLDASQIASYVLTEVEKIRRYLNSLRLISRASPLDVYILCHGRVLADLEQQAQESVVTRYHMVDTADLAEEIGGSSGMPATVYSDALLAQLLARTLPPNYYANAGDTRYYRLRRAGVTMKAVAALLLVSSVGWSALQFAEAVIDKREIGIISRQAGFYESRYARGREQLPKLPAAATQIKLAVEMAGRLREYRETPLAMMAAVSRSLAEFPDLQIDSIDWRSGADPDASLDGRGRRGRGGGRSSGRRLRREPKTTGAYYQLARVKGHVEPFAGDYRAAFAQVNRLVESLASVEGVYRASVLKLPLDIGSQQRLAGTASAEAKVGVASFELRVVLRTRDEAQRS